MGLHCIEMFLADIPFSSLSFKNQNYSIIPPVIYHF